MKYKLPTTWSIQQQAFIDWAVRGKGSCVLDAVAGSGKTTTILAAAISMYGKTAMLAYNNKIGAELKSKLTDLDVAWDKVKAGTVHSFGLNALTKTFGKPEIDENKVEKIIHNLIAAELPHRQAQLLPFETIVKKLVSLAKQKAIGVLDRLHDVNAWRSIIDHFDILDDDKGIDESNIDDIIALAIRVLKVSNTNVKIIDFDDMVYLPLVHPCKFFRYNNVFLDEAQDTNPARRELVKRLLMPNGRLIAVGDQHQAIYGFTGADNDSLDIIAREFNAVRMPLSVTYRCPKAVVDFARQWVSHIEFHANANDGLVSSMSFDDFVKLPLDSSYAVLCRNTKPLVEVAFNLIRRRIACKIEGRDIGKGLIKLARRWKVKSLATYEERLVKFLSNQRANLSDKPRKLEVIEDQVETLRVIIDQCREEKKDTVDAIVEHIESMFADDVRSVLTLSSIHKSKGREWDNVIWLDRFKTCPSKYATQAWMQAQEVNLQYVAATRAMKSLYDMESAVKPVQSA